MVKRMMTLPSLPSVLSSPRFALTRRRVVSLACAAAVLAMTGGLDAQAERFEGKLAFKIDDSQPVNGAVGPVKVSTVKITNLGRGYGRGGFGPKMSMPSELSTVIRFAFDVNNPQDTEWEVTFTLELLDKSGKVIDRATKKEGYEGEAKIFNFDHPVLEYVLPMVTDVRITLQGRID
jgi:hypothetical protein